MIMDVTALQNMQATHPHTQHLLQAFCVSAPMPKLKTRRK